MQLKNKKRTYTLLRTAGLSALSTAIPMQAAHAAERPNVIVILSDDMGYSDIGCFGGVINTPNLDKLANQGLRYTQFYNTARSCPSRASLITGLHPHQTGIGDMTTDRGADGYRGDLNNSCVTIAQVLKQSGYENFAVGKWHMTKSISKDGPKNNWPLQRGFDHYYGTIAGAGSFYDPNTLCRDNQYITPENDPEYSPEQFFYTNAITDNALSFLQEREDEEKPFFMYVAYTAAHWPLHALEEDIQPYEGKFNGGWEQVRDTKYAKMIEQGLIADQWNLSTDNSVTPWENVSEKAFEIRCMEVYAGMVSNMDKNIGRLVDYLQSTGELDNTMIIYLQDNGGCAENYGRDSATPTTIDVPEGKSVVPMGKDELQDYTIPYRTRDGRPVRCGIGTMPGAEDTYLSYGKGWAHVSNTPFREYKRWVHEGGISTPLIIHWPDKLSGYGGELRHQPGQLPDIMATIVDATGTEYPRTYNGNPVIPCEGMSLVPSFGKDSTDYNRELYFEHEGNKAIREGKWKLVYKVRNNKAREIALSDWELYDLEADRPEMNDLSASFPGKVTELSQKWYAFADRCGVKPWPCNNEQFTGNIPENFEGSSSLFNSCAFNSNWAVFGQTPHEASQLAIVNNPDPSRINTSSQCARFLRKSDGLWWAGVNTNPVTPMTFDANNKYVHMMVYREHNQTPLCIKFENGSPVSSTGNIILQPDAEGTSRWVDYVFEVPASKYGTYGRIAIMPDFVMNEAPSVRYNDSIYIYFDEILISNDPQPRTGVITDNSEYKVTDFESGFSGQWGTNGNGNGLAEDHETFRITDNPFKTGRNNSEKVAVFNRKITGSWWAYAWFAFDTVPVISTPKYLHVMVHKPVASTICVQLKDRHASYTANTGEIKSDDQIYTDEWQDIVFEINATGKYCYFEFKPDFINQTPSTRLQEDIDIYFDDIIINSSPEPRESITTGTKPEAAGQSGIRVIPGTTSGKFSVVNNDAVPADMQIFNLTGQLLASTRIAVGQTLINLASQSAGIYLFRFIREASLVQLMKIAN